MNRSSYGVVVCTNGKSMVKPQSLARLFHGKVLQISMVYKMPRHYHLKHARILSHDFLPTAHLLVCSWSLIPNFATSATFLILLFFWAVIKLLELSSCFLVVGYTWRERFIEAGSTKWASSSNMNALTACNAMRKVWHTHFQSGFEEVKFAHLLIYSLVIQLCLQ